MNFSNSVIINKSIKEVIMLFDNPNHLYHWQPDIEIKEIIEGRLGQVGTKMKLRFTNPFMNLDMVETIAAKQYPQMQQSIYESDGVINTVTNTFESINENSTKYTSSSRIEFTNVMMQMMSLMVGSMFESQSKKYLKGFKEFCEAY
jgi:hypothetical protein